jgi:hypothetical protein
MTEETQATLQQPVSEQAQSETLVDATEGTTEEPTQAEEKHFTQDELNAIVQKEKAKAEAKAERRALKAYSEKLEAMTPRQQHAEQAKQPDGKPKLDQFQNVEDYVEAVADWKLEQREQVGKRAAAETQNQTVYNKTEKIYAEAEKLAGFDRESFDELPLTTSIAQAVIESDIAPKLMAHMAANPDEVERISKLSSARQAAEIGKLEAKLSAVKDVKMSKAPAPIKTVGSRGGEVGKNIDTMTMAEFAAFEKARGARYSTR